MLRALVVMGDRGSGFGSFESGPRITNLKELEVVCAGIGARWSLPCRAVAGTSKRASPPAFRRPGSMLPRPGGVSLSQGYQLPDAAPGDVGANWNRLTQR